VSLVAQRQWKRAILLTALMLAMFFSMMFVAVARTVVSNVCMLSPMVAYAERGGSQFVAAAVRGAPKEMKLIGFFTSKSSNRWNGLFTKTGNDDCPTLPDIHARPMPEQFRFSITLQTRYAANFPPSKRNDHRSFIGCRARLHLPT
jgi:hypothetical protein